jgi:hypothetical protein
MMTDPTDTEILNDTSPGELPSGKRLKREYMAYCGPRRPRVGEDFQVLALPTPDPQHLHPQHQSSTHDAVVTAGTTTIQQHQQQQQQPETADVAAEADSASSIAAMPPDESSIMENNDAVAGTAAKE